MITLKAREREQEKGRTMATASDIAVAIEEVVIEHPPEDVVKTSMSVVFAGFCLIIGLLILVVFLWAARGEKGGKPDAFGKRIKVKDVSEKYKAGWFPGKFWPSAKEHSYKTDKGSPLYRAVWFFLIAWFFVAGFYLVLAGAISAIEIFREAEHLRAAACVSAALCLCASWPVFFRIGTHAKGEGPTPTAPADPSAPLPRAEPFNTTKGVFLWIAWAVLTLAAILATAGSSILRAWTLPGPQYGTLLFLGPGYGLFTGWILFATALNCSVAISYNSYPAGTLPWPETRTTYTHRDSLWPPFVALILLLIAIGNLDPAIPLPMLIAVLFFTPRHVTHLVACGMLALGVALSGYLVWDARG